MITDTRPVLLALGIAASLFGVRLLSEDLSDIIPFLGIMAVSFACYFAALWLLRGADTRLSARIIIVLAVLIQLAPYRGSPLWDTDAYRYHWDGKLLAEGINPFRYAPGDHALAHLRGEYWQPMDYKWVKTIYPPVTQYLLAGSYFLDQTPRRVLLLAIGFNLLCLWPLLLLMRRRGISEKWLALYAWNPLMAIVFATGGHLDPISIFFLLFALHFLERSRGITAGTFLALAVMAKTQMLFVAPLVLWRAKWKGLIAFVTLSAALAVPFLDVPLSDLTAGSRAYLGTWEFNSSVFALVQAAVGRTVASAVAAVGVGGLIAWLTVRRGDLLVHVPVVLGALLVLGPTFFPWYLSWVLPFACIFPNATLPVASFLLLSTWLYTWREPVGLMARIPQFALMYAAGVTEVLIRRRRSRTPRQASASDTPSGP
jgi:hypothetical protein